MSYARSPSAVVSTTVGINRWLMLPVYHGKSARRKRFASKSGQRAAGAAARVLVHYRHESAHRRTAAPPADSDSGRSQSAGDRAANRSPARDNRALWALGGPAAA